MIYVIASVHVTPGKRAEFLGIFNANLPEVRAEKGCIEYFPAVDAAADIPPQVLDEDEVTILERWESVEALLAHLSAPHMLAYREKVADVVESVSIKVLREA
ncbi:MAG TPA: putative quinol monooxygenase [Syntrophorhabdaceae bacterium]|jgi:quinol monooxygenase YgiN